MKTGKILWGLALAAALALPAAANLRAPRKVDGTFSGNLAAAPKAARLRLMGERLEAAFPAFDLSNTDYRSPVRFRVVYEIENPGSAPVTIPLRFLAVDIRDLSVEINGRAVKAAVRKAPEEKAECVAVMTRHRAEFLPGFYKDFLGRLKAGTGAEKRPAWSDVFVRSLEQTDEDQPAAADFEAVLPPGRNNLVVTYGQRMFIDERNHGYFAVWPKKGVTGFDYLLYPAKSWEIAPGFKLAVSVTVPDASGKKMMIRIHRKATVRSNLALKEAPAKSGSRDRIYAGEFQGGMPADVLTFLLWFDENAASYVR
jgi:hypothetical protein